MARSVLFVVMAAFLVALLIYSQQPHGPVTVSGFVEADEIRVGSRVGGRVQRVLVEEGQRVHAGDVLVELEPFDLLERKTEAQQVLAQAAAVQDRLTAGFRPEEIAQAAARVNQLQAELDKLRNGPRPQEIAAAESTLHLADAELELAIKVHQRAESLFGRQAVDKNELDEAATKLSVARSTVETHREQLALLKGGSRQEDVAKAEAALDEAMQQLQLQKNGYRAEDIREAKARREAAQAAVQAVQRQLDELEIISPANAVVEAIELQPGDLLSANAPAIALITAQELWVRAYVPENRLNLQTGQSLKVRVDSFPRRTFAGKVSFVARQAEFTPANVQTAEERSKQVFRIKVQMTEGLDVLRPGMAADVLLP